MPRPPVKATLVVDIVRAQDTPGAFSFYRTEASGKEFAGLKYVCPCGCKKLGSLPFKPAESPSWKWDGNREAPTLAPSIHHRNIENGKLAGTHWHGHLTDGVWIDS